MPIRDCFTLAAALLPDVQASLKFAAAAAVNSKVPIPKDPTQKDSIAERLFELRKKNAPVGLPEGKPNSDDTDPDFPLRHNLPKDPGWAGTKMITGSGGGPIL